MRRGIAHRGERPEEELRLSREEDDQSHARGCPPARAVEARPEGEEERQERQEDGRVEDVRRVVAEQPDPAREEERVAGRVAAVEAPVIGDVALHQHVDLRRQPRRERIERRPVVEDPAVQQVVREGEVAELVDGEVPGGVLVNRERGQHEQLGRGGEPEGGEHARQRHGPEQHRAAGRRCGPGLRAAARGGGCGRRRHAALYPGPARREKRVGVAARGCYESRVAVAFSPLVARWFEERFGTPTPAQAAGWPAIARGADTLIAAPTGSGKTLAAFLWSLDRLLRAAGTGGLEERTDVVYVSPLKALGNDVQRNLARPLAEMRALAEAAGAPLPEIRALVRSGDTPASERRAMGRRPPHILVTTPESLYILLTAEGSRRWLAGARTVIVDEIHAVAADKRGAHLALSLERLDALAGRRLQRIGLSATQRPIEEVARLLVGAGAPRPCAIVDVGHRRALELA
ncbi:MAG: DEAD/DEAH box helicase, partial [Deltaproteobacteria bacterium]